MTDLVIALDVPSRREAAQVVDALGPEADFYKVGLQLFTAEGPSVVHWLRALGKRVFLDLKLHDIPNTVAGAVRAALELEVELLTIHASGGVEMMAAAVEASEGRALTGSTVPLRLLAVTVLTSLTESQLDRVWGPPEGSPGMEERVLRMATGASDAGIQGLVCSPWEVGALRRALGPEWYLLTPGVRLEGQDPGDQARVMTPRRAVELGSSALVLGRAVTAAADPAAALAAARLELSAVTVRSSGAGGSPGADESVPVSGGGGR